MISYLLYPLIFIVSSAALMWGGGKFIAGLIKMGRLLKWREFVVAFFVMALASSLPNLFVGINSALHKIPQLSLGDIIGGNLVDLTLVIALAALIAKTGVPAESRMVQTSAIFTAVIAIMPLLLMLDGKLGRGDGIVLLSIFSFYIYWIFSKDERFKKVYNGEKDGEEKTGVIFTVRDFIKTVAEIIVLVVFLLVAAEGVVLSVRGFIEKSGLSLEFVSILIVGLGNVFPEAYFALISAKKGQTWMILGDLMGSVIIPSTLVLGIVSLIHPIRVFHLTPFAVARVFLIVAAFFFLIIIRSDKKITKKEAIILLFLYLLFFAVEVIII